jgi:hypothetical protein
MPLDASIYGDFKTPQAQTSPLQTIATLMALKGQMAEIPLRLAQAEHARQQAAQEAIATQQKQRQQQDESTLRELMSDPEAAPKIASGDLSPLNGRVNYDFQQGIAKNIEELHKNAALANKDDLANKSTALNALAEGIQGLGEDPAQINANLTAFKSNPANALLFKNAGIDPSTIPTVSDAADLKKWEAGVGVAQAVTNKALALKESQAKNALTEAQTIEAINKGKESAATAQMTQQKADLMKTAIAEFQANPQGGASQIDTIIPASLDKTANASYKASYASAMATGGPDAAQKVIEAAATHAASISPEKRQADIKEATDKALSEAQATEKIKIHIAGAEAAARAAVATPDAGGLDMMAEAALSGQAPSSRNPAVVRAIWDRAAQIAASRGQTAVQALASANAAKASREALNSVTKQYETLKPFAEMAEKNAAVLEQQMAKVSDLGAPFLNAPVRALESKFAGNTNVAAFHAALLPVQADFARILNSPTAGGQLTDTARSEMEGAMSPNATVGQVKAALDIFRQDAHNRKAAYEAQLQDLKGASVAGGGAPAAAPKYKAGDTRVVNGVTYTRDDSGNWHAK